MSEYNDQRRVNWGKSSHPYLYPEKSGRNPTYREKGSLSTLDEIRQKGLYVPLMADLAGKSSQNRT